LRDEDGELRFDVELPVSKDKITARLLKMKHQPQISRIRRKHSQSLLSHLMMIRSSKINDEPIKTPDYFQNIDLADYDYFSEAYKSHEFGIETTQQVVCSECYEEFEAELPVDMSFLLGKHSL